ncbi:TetR/AcrR family transcriptional regulator [Thalassobius sp. I31.1]|uniref:TetR/AcrR family transcriptional regulator n=1 Tax=Thalassobius sp. I31.1 TaxID=2109912 RepID=UPI000D1BD96C|nr:TetR/AcrR family transcriptional regulator [Thalassobius sp. I31.1]
MNTRDQNIVEIAFRRFAHYGVKKTTISEIAADAKVSRQTLYNAFDSKEELMAGAMFHYARKSADAVLAECDGITDIARRLEIAFQNIALIPFEAMGQIPHAEEIMQLVDQISPEKKAGLANIYAEGVWNAISPANANIRAAGLDPDDFSHFIRSSFAQMKKEANDADDLRARFKTLALILHPALTGS